MFTLQQALDAFEGRQEFVKKELKDTVCFDYMVVKEDSFTDPKHGWIRKNFRGTTFCKHTGKLLSLPFPKFFNINQTADSQFVLHKDKKATIYEKVDGSLIHFYCKNNSEIVASTCRSPESLQAKEALTFVENNKKLLFNIKESIDNGLTPMFEWCAPHNQIVVFYENARLVYLMSRSRKDGKFVFENKYDDKVEKFDIPFGEIINHTSMTGREGYVCYLNDGNVFKVKTTWYLERHKSVDLLTRPKYKAYEVSLDGYMDDIISLAPDGHKSVFVEIDNEVKNDIVKLTCEYEGEFSELLKVIGNESSDNLRKAFVSVAKKSENFAVLMQLFSGKKIDHVIKKRLMEKYTKLYPMKVMR